MREFLESGRLVKIVAQGKRELRVVTMERTMRLLADSGTVYEEINHLDKTRPPYSFVIMAPHGGPRTDWCAVLLGDSGAPSWADLSCRTRARAGWCLARSAEKRRRPPLPMSDGQWAIRVQ